MERCPPGPAPPVRYDGLFATAGLPEPEPPPPAAGPFVAIAVGKTKEGESLPAKPGSTDRQPVRREYEQQSNDIPSLEKPVPLLHRVSFLDAIICRCTLQRKAATRNGNVLVHDNGRRMGSHGGEKAAQYRPDALGMLCGSFKEGFLVIQWSLLSRAVARPACV